MKFNKGDVLPPQFRLESQLGIGGFSEVWRATDLQAQDDVAIKIFLKQDEDGIDLCREEYRRMNYLRHPNILQPRYFSHYEGAPFIVMPFCALGSTMNRLGRFDEKQLASLIAQIASALGHIHTMAQPMIHNDIKPDNILEERSGNFVLADFGISERLSRKLIQSVPDDTQQTQMLNVDRKAGMAPMAYRAPEQFNFAGRVRQGPSAATDVWAFGATIYQIATGQLPFETEGGLRQLTYHNANNALNVNDIVSPLPRDRYAFELDALLKRCLALDPDQRPDANYIADAARRFLSTGTWPAIAPPQPPPPPPPPSGAIQVSQPDIQFGDIPIGKTGMHTIYFQAEGLPGVVHVAVMPPFVVALPGQPLRSSLDIPVSGGSDSYPVEVHFEPDNTDPASGELYFSHPAVGQQQVHVWGRGKKDGGGGVPWWLIAGIVGLLALAGIAYYVFKGMRPVVPPPDVVVVPPDPKKEEPAPVPVPPHGNDNGPTASTNGPSRNQSSTTPKTPTLIGPIVPVLSLPQLTAKVGQPVVFRDDTRISKGQKVLKKRWNFDEGSPSEEMGSSVSHTYKGPGDYRVQLCLNDSLYSPVITLVITEDAPACSPPFSGSKRESAGASTTDRCGDSEAAKQWSPGGTITLRPTRNVQLRSAKLYADHPGKVIIKVKDNNAECFETFSKNVAQGSNEFGFTEDFTLSAGRTYTMTVSTQIKGFNIAPRLENIAPCNPNVPTSTVLGLNYNGNIILFNLTFEY